MEPWTGKTLYKIGFSTVSLGELVEDGRWLEVGFKIKERFFMIGQRISASGIVVQNGKVLLVHHYQKHRFDFWVIPGGGVEGNEGILRAAEREVWEETNLIVKAERIAYIEDFVDEGKYVCKFWVYCCLENGDLNIAHKDANEDFLTDAKFFSKEELQRLNAFPSILKDVFWQDLEGGFPTIKYLGYRQHEN